MNVAIIVLDSRVIQTVASDVSVTVLLKFIFGYNVKQQLSG